MKLFQKPLIQRLPFPIPGCSLSCSTVYAYTDTIRWNCASSKQLSFLTAPQGVRAPGRFPAGTTDPQDSTRAGARPARPNPRIPTHLTLCFPGNSASELLNFSLAMASQLYFHTEQGSFITAIYSYIPHLCSFG